MAGPEISIQPEMVLAELSSLVARLRSLPSPESARVVEGPDTASVRRFTGSLDLLGRRIASKVEEAGVQVNLAADDIRAAVMDLVEQDASAKDEVAPLLAVLDAVVGENPAHAAKRGPVTPGSTAATSPASAGKDAAAW